MDFKNAVTILGLTTDYSESELKSQWRKLAKQFHPDICHESEKFKEVLSAYDFLKNRDNNIGYQQEWFDHVSQEAQFNHQCYTKGMCQEQDIGNLIFYIVAILVTFVGYVALAQINPTCAQLNFEFQVKVAGLIASAFAVFGVVKI